MSKGDRDGRGFRHHKKCPSLNCDYCVNGRARRPARRKARRQEHRQWMRDFISEATYQEPEYPPGFDPFPEGAYQHPGELEGILRVRFIPALTARW